ncbi:unnamed protein product [Mucor hiemalis]
MPSTIPTSEKKRKSSKSSSKSKRSSKHSDDQQDLLGEPVKATKSRKSKSSKKLKEELPVDDTQEETVSTDDTTDKIEEVADEGENKAEEVADEVTNGVQDLAENLEQTNEDIDDVKEQVQDTIEDDSETEGEFDSDALTTMNAIMEYNRMLVQRLHELEDKTGGLNKEAVQDTVKNTMDEVSAKYNKEQSGKGTHHSFELPIGDMMKGYGSLSAEPLADASEEKDSAKKADDEENTTVDGGDDGKIHIGNGEKDDIVVKVEATKTGITFSIHIPRN